MNEGEEAFLVALRDVVAVSGGVTALSRATGLIRVSFYRLLSGNGNPTLSSLNGIPRALGLEIRCRPSGKHAKNTA